MEPTTKLNEVADNPRSRRALLAGVVGGLGAWLVSAAQRAMPAEAAVGDPIRIGQTNSGGGFSTELRANTTKPTFRAVQLGGGNALRGEASSGRGVVGIGGHEGTGVWAYSPDHNAVYATTDTGNAVVAIAPGAGSVAIFAAGTSAPGSFAIRADGPTLLVGDTQVFGNVTVGGRLAVSSGMTLDAIPGESAPGPHQARLFAKLNGLGKTEFCVRFPSGDIQVLATEP